MAAPTSRVAVDDSDVVALFTGYEGKRATVINRGPDACVVADTEAKCDPGTGAQDATVDSLTLELNDFVDVELGSRDDDLFATCATGDTACLHILLGT